MNLFDYLVLEAKAERECPEAWEAMSVARSDARDENGNAYAYLQSKLASQATTEKAEKWLIRNGVTF